ncbi:hypothetical protein SKAU_G00298050 [Synaphobranchus kaupii]|uniref:Uncharacterized protein n=1 Tax=Synaphobranchus kaupii TaxID=118154 RepID=A0A9Q1IM10_SYNKA|nr:hypothetical protein SKAU_G00298050 [Synaphobranchus kaupii]
MESPVGPNADLDLTALSVYLLDSWSLGVAEPPLLSYEREEAVQEETVERRLKQTRKDGETDSSGMSVAVWAGGSGLASAPEPSRSCVPRLYCRLVTGLRGALGGFDGMLPGGGGVATAAN